MKKAAYGLWLMVYGVFLLSAACFAQTAVSSAELIEHAKELDGQEVLYQGEIIGEVMVRKDGAWANLHDGENALGVWMPNNFLNLISFTGSYTARGDWLEVRGIFNRACKMHGADLDIHATNLARIRDGRPLKHRLVLEKQRSSIILSGVLLCLLILQFLRKKPKVR